MEVLGRTCTNSIVRHNTPDTACNIYEPVEDACSASSSGWLREATGHSFSISVRTLPRTPGCRCVLESWHGQRDSSGRRRRTDALVVAASTYGGDSSSLLSYGNLLPWRITQSASVAFIVRNPQLGQRAIGMPQNPCGSDVTTVINGRSTSATVGRRSINRTSPRLRQCEHTLRP